MALSEPWCQQPALLALRSMPIAQALRPTRRVYVYERHRIAGAKCLVPPLAGEPAQDSEIGVLCTGHSPPSVNWHPSQARWMSPGHVVLGQVRRGDPLPADCFPYRNGTCVTESERASDSNHGLTTPNAESALITDGSQTSCLRRIST